VVKKNYTVEFEVKFNYPKNLKTNDEYIFKNDITNKFAGITELEIKNIFLSSDYYFLKPPFDTFKIFAGVLMTKPL